MKSTPYRRSNKTSNQKSDSNSYRKANRYSNRYSNGRSNRRSYERKTRARYDTYDKTEDDDDLTPLMTYIASDQKFMVLRLLNSGLMEKRHLLWVYFEKGLDGLMDDVYEEMAVKSTPTKNAPIQNTKTHLTKTHLTEKPVPVATKVTQPSEQRYREKNNGRRSVGLMVTIDRNDRNDHNERKKQDTTKPHFESKVMPVTINENLKKESNFTDAAEKFFNSLNIAKSDCAVQILGPNETLWDKLRVCEADVAVVKNEANRVQAFINRCKSELAGFEGYLKSPFASAAQMNDADVALSLNKDKFNSFVRDLNMSIINGESVMKLFVRQLEVLNGLVTSIKVELRTRH